MIKEFHELSVVEITKILNNHYSMIQKVDYENSRFCFQTPKHISAKIQWKDNQICIVDLINLLSKEMILDYRNYNELAFLVHKHNVRRDVERWSPLI